MKKIIFQNHSCKIGTHYLYDIQYTYTLININGVQYQLNKS